MKHALAQEPANISSRQTTCKRIRRLYGPTAFLQAPCCSNLMKQWQINPPLQGYKAILNVHLTLATLILIDTLLASGLELSITCAPDLVCHDNIKQDLIKAGLRVIEYEDLTHYRDEFDIAFDCGAYMLHSLEPKFGFIELTHVPNEYYREAKKPTITIDKGLIKLLETTFGTGDGFLRGMEYLMGKQGRKVTELNYLLFGFGKVGTGIMHCLRKAGVPNQQIVIVEKNSLLIENAHEMGYEALNVDTQQGVIRKIIPQIDCAVTATGEANAISPSFKQKDFGSVETLVNMGTYNEWGPSFSEGRIINYKKPLNFMLEFPTAISYIDPVFATLASTALFRIKHPAILPNNYPQTVVPEIEQPIVEYWVAANEQQEELELIRSLYQL